MPPASLSDLRTLRGQRPMRGLLEAGMLLAAMFGRGLGLRAAAAWRPPVVVACDRLWGDSPNDRCRRYRCSRSVMPGFLLDDARSVAVLHAYRRHGQRLACRERVVDAGYR